MSWRNIMEGQSPAHNPQNSQNIPIARGSGGFENIKHRVLITEAPQFITSDIADHYHERAATLEFAGECPRDLADHVALLETLRWWLHLQHPEIIAQWLFMAEALHQ